MIEMMILGLFSGIALVLSKSKKIDRLVEYLYKKDYKWMI